MMNQAVNRAFYQGIGAYVNCLNNLRIQDLQIAMKMIDDEARHVILNKDNASKILNYARNNIEDVILKNRGGEYGGHGFIAEFAEAGIVNARRAFEGLNPIVKVLNDNGPADLLIGRNTIQMKFYNNLRDELCQSFHYSKKMKMMFPKDHVLVYEKIMAGAKEVEFNGKKLSIKQITDIRQMINDITERKGLTSYKSWMKSSVLNYDDAQRNSINKVLDLEKIKIDKKVKVKRRELAKKKILAKKNSLPNLREANKIAKNTFLLQGGLALMSAVYGKNKEGKTIFEFEQSDWLDCGLETVEGAVKASISGYAIYGLTNVFKMSAPYASAFVTASYGMVDIITKLRTNEITEDEFINFITINTLDTTLATIGSCVGQTLIPVPVLGAVVGSIATSIIWEIGKGILSDREQELIQNYRENLDNHIKNLDDKYKIIFNDIIDKYHKLGRLQDYSFDLSINIRLRFEYSIELAEQIGVSNSQILHNLSEIDSYFLN
ncbi:hypothetical protein HMPREF2619_07300 [Streptococcus sp. HMSC074B11]|uniref:Uncharacterized protein n=1 Tax=Streptococcus infantis TaxID=68892 RepID=A0A0F3H1W8_9STRE|nr:MULTISPECIES: hypothetical protein [Streptococcus]KJU88204.1 hypothetical protein TZ96_01915 [Streptococcus infantis]MDN5024840.1 hypothetical protein [Streptococcus sp. SO4]OFN96545.1 hypothetical protein HMPREF2619_07300 [Streptococcus sp. HMSC074B11]